MAGLLSRRAAAGGLAGLAIGAAAAVGGHFAMSTSERRPNTAVRLFRDVAAVCKIARVYREAVAYAPAPERITTAKAEGGAIQASHVDQRHAEGAAILLDLCRRNGGVCVTLFSWHARASCPLLLRRHPRPAFKDTHAAFRVVGTDEPAPPRQLPRHGPPPGFLIPPFRLLTVHITTRVAACRLVVCPGM
jgi:hypothetical protein